MRRTSRETIIGNEVARLAASCESTLLHRPLERYITQLIRELEPFRILTVVKALQSLHGAERLPTADEVEMACERVVGKRHMRASSELDE